jgi:hypothetical protein
VTAAWAAEAFGDPVVRWYAGRRSGRGGRRGARIVVIEGQEHVADVLVPEVFAEQVLAFLRDQR